MDFLLELQAKLPIFATSAALSIARAMGIVIVFPFFSKLQLTPLLKLGAALGMSMLYIPVVHTYMEVLPEINIGVVAILVFKEFIVGLILGLFLGLPFWAILAMGEVIDTYRGASAATLFDPSAQGQATIFGDFMLMLSLAIFVSVGGLINMTALLYHSFILWSPITLEPDVQMKDFSVFTEIFGGMLIKAVLSSLPFLIVMFMAEMTAAICSRIAQKLNVFDLSMALKNLVMFLILGPFLLVYMHYVAPSLIDFPLYTKTLSNMFGTPT